MEEVPHVSSDVLSAIPHRPPFLFVDRILRRSETEIVAERILRKEEAFFQGHYPQIAIMPGVLLCEALFQTAGVLMSGRLSKEEKDGKKIPVLVRIESAKFKQMVFPGDRLQLEVQFVEKMKDFYFFKGSASQGNKRFVSIEFILGMVEREAILPTS